MEILLFLGVILYFRELRIKDEDKQYKETYQTGN